MTVGPTRSGAIANRMIAAKHAADQQRGRPQPLIAPFREANGWLPSTSERKPLTKPVSVAAYTKVVDALKLDPSSRKTLIEFARTMNDAFVRFTALTGPLAKATEAVTSAKRAFDQTPTSSAADRLAAKRKYDSAQATLAKLQSQQSAEYRTVTSAKSNGVYFLKDALPTSASGKPRRATLDALRETKGMLGHATYALSQLDNRLSDVEKLLKQQSSVDDYNQRSPGSRNDKKGYESDIAYEFEKAIEATVKINTQLKALLADAKRLGVTSGPDLSLTQLDSLADAFANRRYVAVFDRKNIADEARKEVESVRSALFRLEERLDLSTSTLQDKEATALREATTRLFP